VSIGKSYIIIKKMQISRHTSIVVLLELTDFYYFMTNEMLTTIGTVSGKKYHVCICYQRDFNCSSRKHLL